MNMDGRLELDEHESPLERSRRLLNHVALCLKLATIHELANKAMSQPIQQLVELVNDAMLDHERLRIQVIGENVFLNNELIKLNYSTYESATSLRKVYERLSISEIAFTAEISGNHLRAFLQGFQSHYRSQSPESLIQQKFSRIEVRAIEEATQETGAAQIDERENLMRCYARLIVTTTDSLNALENGKPPRLARIRRSVQALAEAARGHESLLLALTRLVQQPNELAAHLSSVAAMSLLLVTRLGASRRVTSECCMAALLHDVGRGQLSRNIDATDLQRLMQEHARAGAESMLRICRRNISPRALGFAATAHDCTQLIGPSTDNVLARLIAVPCAFDLMTSTGLQGGRIRPDHAMRLLFEEDRRFDPDVVKLFAKTVGIIPVGTTVRLTGGELAIVMDVPADASLYDRPRVKVVQTADARPADYMMDLADFGGSVAIAGSVDAIQADINVPHFLLA